MKTRFAILLVWLLITTGVRADDIAQCSNPSGMAYYPYLNMVQKKSSGWEDSKITGGITTLSKIGKDEYDIFFVDATKRIVSSKQDGGKVILLSRNEKEISVLVVYRTVVEVYNFYVDNSGKAEYTTVTSRIGWISTVRAMRGDCQFVKLDF